MNNPIKDGEGFDQIYFKGNIQIVIHKKPQGQSASPFVYWKHKIQKSMRKHNLKHSFQIP